MGGFNPHESLTQRIKDWRERAISSEVVDILGEILAVLEGRLMIDAEGMLREPCKHPADERRLCYSCQSCGQVAQSNALTPTATQTRLQVAAELAATLIVSEMSWGDLKEGAEYWDKVFVNLRRIGKKGK